MQVPPGTYQAPEAVLSVENAPSESRSVEFENSYANGHGTMKNTLNGTAGPSNLSTEMMNTTTTMGTVQGGKKRAAPDDSYIPEASGNPFSSNAHTGAIGVQATTKAKSAAKKARLDEGLIRDPPCYKCRDAEITCVGSLARSSCNACFAHHWKCTTAIPLVKPKKPRHSESSLALRTLISDPGTTKKTTRSQTAGSRASSQTSTATPPPTESISAPPPRTAIHTAPLRKKLTITDALRICPEAEPPVLMLAPPSVSAPRPKVGLGPTGQPSGLTSTGNLPTMDGYNEHDSAGPIPDSEGAPLSVIHSKYTHGTYRKPSRKPAAAPAPKPRDKRLRVRSSKQPRYADNDSDLDEEVQATSKTAKGKGKEKAVAVGNHQDNGDASELSSPPSSNGEFAPFETSYLGSINATGELPSIPSSSSLPFTISALNALINVANTIHSDIGELKETSGSRSILDWGITLDKLEKQERIIQDQTRTIEKQSHMLEWLVKNMKELSGGKFPVGEFKDPAERKCEVTNRIEVPNPALEYAENRNNHEHPAYISISPTDGPTRRFPSMTFREPPPTASGSTHSSHETMPERLTAAMAQK